MSTFTVTASPSEGFGFAGPAVNVSSVGAIFAIPSEGFGFAGGSFVKSVTNTVTAEYDITAKPVEGFGFEGTDLRLRFGFEFFAQPAEGYGFSGADIPAPLLVSSQQHLDYTVHAVPAEGFGFAGDDNAARPLVVTTGGGGVTVAGLVPGDKYVVIVAPEAEVDITEEQP